MKLPLSLEFFNLDWLTVWSTAVGALCPFPLVRRKQITRYWSGKPQDWMLVCRGRWSKLGMNQKYFVVSWAKLEWKTWRKINPSFLQVFSSVISDGFWTLTSFTSHLCLSQVLDLNLVRERATPGCPGIFFTTKFGWPGGDHCLAGKVQWSLFHLPLSYKRARVRKSMTQGQDSLPATEKQHLKWMTAQLHDGPWSRCRPSAGHTASPYVPLWFHLYTKRHPELLPYSHPLWMVMPSSLDAPSL